MVRQHERSLESTGLLRSAAGKPVSEHDEKERCATAYHEAGHAVMRLMLGRSVTRATIKSEGDTLGSVGHRPAKVDTEWLGEDWATRRWAETAIMVALAGPEAEQRLTGSRNGAGAASDDAWVHEVSVDAEGYADERRQAYLRWLQLKVRDWVNDSQFWRQVEAVAAALLERETLTGAEVDRIRRQALGIKELSLAQPVVTARSRNIGYGWSTKATPKSPDVVGTLAAVRRALEKAHSELDPPFYERLFVRGVPIDDRGGELSAREILGSLEAEARWRRDG